MGLLWFIFLIPLGLILIGEMYDVYYTKKRIQQSLFNTQLVKELRNNSPEIPPPYTGKKMAINQAEYDRFILTKNTTKAYLLNAIKENGESSGQEEMAIHPFGFAQQGKWYIIQVGRDVSFCCYHDLVSWLAGLEQGADAPDLSVGFARHVRNKRKDYLCYEDPQSTGDTVIGAFRQEGSFFICLSEENLGNETVRVSPEVDVSFADTLRSIAEHGLSLDSLDKLTFEEHQVMINNYC